jgi:hypothetical protein
MRCVVVVFEDASKYGALHHPQHVGVLPPDDLDDGPQGSQQLLVLLIQSSSLGLSRVAKSTAVCATEDELVVQFSFSLGDLAKVMSEAKYLALIGLLRHQAGKSVTYPFRSSS